MRTTIERTPLATPYLAVPPPAGRAARSAPSAREAMRRLYHRHAATLGAIATIVVAVAALDWLLIPRGPDSLPLWLVLAAGFGSVAVGASVRRLERRGAPRRGGAVPAAPAEASAGWRDGVGIGVAAASVALLLLALVVPHEARSIVLAAGLTGVLTLRLLLPPHRIATAIDGDDARVAAAPPHGARSPITPGGAR